MNNQDNKPLGDNQQNSNQIGNLSIFEGKRHHAYFHEKIQKLLIAIYLVTDLIKDSEPIKWKIRERVLELPPINLSLIDAFGDEKRIAFRDMSAICLEVISMIEVALHSGLISRMNFELIKTEMIAVLALMEERLGYKIGASNLVLSENFFKTDETLLEPDAPALFTLNQGNPPKGQSEYKGHYKGQQTIKDIKPFGHSNSTTARNTATNNEDKRLRQRAIVDLIKKLKREVTIKDLLSGVSGCSEKTIQRELIALVDKGVLKKTGERRWSKYSLN